MSILYDLSMGVVAKRVIGWIPKIYRKYLSIINCNLYVTQLPSLFCPIAALKVLIYLVYATIEMV